VKSIKICVEGGDSAEQKAQLRVGLDALLRTQKDLSRQRRIKWAVAFCGSRRLAFDAFLNAVECSDTETLVVLLVDSEEAVASEVDDPHLDAEVRRDHLVRRDHWNFKGVPPSRVHLMVQCMEAWIVADPEALANFYGEKFRIQDLPVRGNLEEEPKLAIYEKLKRATRSCRKGEYAKIRHASKLLALICPGKVADRCPRFKTFTKWLSSQIEEAPIR
jgi:hypothetical protein